MADSARWERFAFRPDDVVISTPSFDRAKRRAKAEGRTVSEIAREALARYLAS